MTNYESSSGKEPIEKASTGSYRERFTELMAEGRQPDLYDQLLEMAQPLLEEPPEHMWAEVSPAETGEETVSVPFTAKELSAIDKARQAHRRLAADGSRGSGAARDFIPQTRFFPQTAERLKERKLSVWGIMTAAVYAEEVWLTCEGSAWEPQGEILEAFTTIRDLPDVLIALNTDES